MAILLDTSVLGRLANAGDKFHHVAISAITELRRQRENLYLTPQNYTEFWNVATRPLAVNGLGFTAAETKIKVDTFAATFLLLEETPDIFPMWLAIVDTLGVVGKQVHDARLAACCYVHKIDKVLTFNVSHFSRLTAFRPGLAVLDPATV